MPIHPPRFTSADTTLNRRPDWFPMIALLMSGLIFTTTAAAGNLSDANANYQQDREFCNSGKSYQDRTTCLREAGAVLMETRRGRLDDYPGSFHDNALARCNALPADDRDACRRRVDGEGTTSGSVYAGGLLRELVVPDKDQ